MNPKTRGQEMEITGPIYRYITVVAGRRTRMGNLFNLITGLGWEQLKAIEFLSDVTNGPITGVQLCNKVDCSFKELFILVERGLITDPTSPVLTDNGKIASGLFKTKEDAGKKDE